MKAAQRLQFSVFKATFARVLVFIVLAGTVATNKAADDPTSAKLISHPLGDVHAAIEAFCKQATTNTALRPFVTSQLGKLQAFTNSTTEIGVTICDCGTTSACYTITAIAVSPETTRLEVSSMDTLPDEHRRNFRPKRNTRVIEELLRLLEKKP